MQVTINVPDDLAESLGRSSPEIARRMLEAFAIQSYRSRTLTAWQIQNLLGFQNRFELDAFLNQSGVSRDYTADELALDYESSHRASSDRSPTS